MRSSAKHIPLPRERGLLFLLLFTAALYLGTLPYGFVHDDWASVARNPHLREIRNLGRFFTDPTTFSSTGVGTATRPLLLVSFALNFVFGESAFGFRLVNLLLHLGNTVLVFAFLRRLLAEADPDEGRLPRREAALAAAALFALHPLNAQAVVYVSSRSALLAFTFYVGALLAFLRFRSLWREGEFRTARLAATLGLIFCALLTKEHTVSIAGTLLLIEVGLFQGRRFDPLRFAVSLGLAAGPVVLFLLYRGAVIQGAPTAGAGAAAGSGLVFHSTTVKGPYRLHLATQAKALFVYLRLFFLPAGFALQHPVTPVRSLAEPGFLAAAAAILPAAAWATVGAFRRRPAAILLLWFLLCLAPESLVRLNMTVNEHRFYLPGLGMTGIAGLAFVHLRARSGRKPALAAGLALLALLTFQTYGWSRAWKDECTLWEHTVRVSSDDSWSQNNAGNCRLMAGDLAGAEAAYRQALRLAPDNAMAVYNLAIVQEKQGRLREALRLYRRFDRMTSGARHAEIEGILRQIEARLREAPR